MFETMIYICKPILLAYLITRFSPLDWLLNWIKAEFHYILIDLVILFITCISCVSFWISLIMFRDIWVAIISFIISKIYDKIFSKWETKITIG